MDKLSITEIENTEKKGEKKQSNKPRYVKLLYLITSEGTKTEPNYFTSLRKELIENGRFSLNYEEIEIQGKKKATVKLIKKTIGTRDCSGKKYDRVWAVFDKDSFTDFDEAIKLGNDNNINCAWSNESFELWLLLHFTDVDSSLGRKEYNEKLEEIILEHMKKTDPQATFSYSKGNPDLYKLVNKYGNEAAASDRAKKLISTYSSDVPFSNQKPCTRVFELINELRHPETVKLYD